MDILILSACFVLGSVPFGLVFGLIFAQKDIRNFGSGNIGATNVLRVVGKIPALLTLICDSGKGAFAIWFASQMGLDEYLAFGGGIITILGHCYSVFLKFKGGKGVATSFGVILMQVPEIGLMGLGVWLIIFGWTRYSSLSAISAFAIMPILALFLNETLHIMPEIVIGLVILSWFVISRHKENIIRLKNKTESRFEFKK